MRNLSTDELKKVQLDILQAVHDFCDKNNIRYYLAYGTLLGAVRHKGYIPWDDDIDICMLRSDYEKFTVAFKNDRCKVFKFGNDNEYPFLFAKVARMDTIMRENNKLIKSDFLGVNIDVFPMDGFPSKNSIFPIFRKVKWYKRVFAVKAITVDSKRSIWKNLFIVVCRVLLEHLNIYCLNKKVDKIIKTYENNQGNKFVGNIICGYSTSDIVRKECFDNVIAVDFEGHKFLAPAGYDEILTAIYGDYMEPPPIEERVTHHTFKAYWRE